MTDSNETDAAATIPAKALKKKAGKKRANRPKARAGAARSAARVQMPAEQLPRKSLEQALRVAKALREVHAGGPAKWPQIAEAMGISGAQVNKYFLWSAQAYGLIEKEDDAYVLSEIGRKILAPTKANEDKEALVRALMTPVLFSRFFTEYNGNPFPGEEHIGNVLEVRYGVPRERVDEAKGLLKENGIFAGVLRQTDNGMLVSLDPTITGVPARIESPPSAEGVMTEGGESSTSAQGFDTMCFVVTPIGDDDSEQRKHANMVLKNVIEPVVTELGLKAMRADQIDRAGLITKQIFECLAHARICVADLSFNNPNAFYELGVRHMCKLPTVQIIRKGDRIPFDVSQGRTIKIDMTDVYSVLESVDSAKRELRQHLKAALATEYKGEDNPINTYLPGVTVNVPKP
jgi:hypothetical protein